MLQQDKPDDYVLASGKSYSVREFVEKLSTILIGPFIGKTKELMKKALIRKLGKWLLE